MQINSLGLVFFLASGNANVSELKLTFGRYLTPVMFLVAVYYWLHYFKAKRQSLRVTETSICWQESGKDHVIEWSQVQSIDIIDLTKAGKQGFAYEFSVSGSLGKPNEKPTLYVGDYSIEPNNLLSIVNSLAKQNGFTVSTDV